MLPFAVIGAIGARVERRADGERLRTSLQGSPIVPPDSPTDDRSWTRRRSTTRRRRWAGPATTARGERGAGRQPEQDDVGREQHERVQVWAPRTLPVFIAEDTNDHSSCGSSRARVALPLEPVRGGPGCASRCLAPTASRRGLDEPEPRVRPARRRRAAAARGQPARRVRRAAVRAEGRAVDVRRVPRVRRARCTRPSGSTLHRRPVGRPRDALPPAEVERRACARAPDRARVRSFFILVPKTQIVLEIVSDVEPRTRTASSRGPRARSCACRTRSSRATGAFEIAQRHPDAARRVEGDEQPHDGRRLLHVRCSARGSSLDRTGSIALLRGALREAAVLLALVQRGRQRARAPRRAPGRPHVTACSRCGSSRRTRSRRTRTRASSAALTAGSTTTTRSRATTARARSWTRGGRGAKHWYARLATPLMHVWREPAYNMYLVDPTGDAIQLMGNWNATPVGGVGARGRPLLARLVQREPHRDAEHADRRRAAAGRAPNVDQRAHFSGAPARPPKVLYPPRAATALSRVLVFARAPRAEGRAGRGARRRARTRAARDEAEVCARLAGGFRRCAPRPSLARAAAATSRVARTTAPCHAATSGAARAGPHRLADAADEHARARVGLELAAHAVAVDLRASAGPSSRTLEQPARALEAHDVARSPHAAYARTTRSRPSSATSASARKLRRVHEHVQHVVVLGQLGHRLV